MSNDGRGMENLFALGRLSHAAADNDLFDARSEYSLSMKQSGEKA